jgi:oligopeptide transport system permease protein
VAIVIGTLYGATSGYLGGRSDDLMMRVVDILYGIPYMLIVLLIMVAVGERGLVPLFGALGLFQWLTTARIVRGQVLAFKNREFVQAARTIGASGGRIIFRHLLPNTMGPVIVYSTLMVPAVILQEAFLSYLGLGVQQPHTSWGLLASDGARAINPIETYWWILVFPALFLASTLLALNFLGDGLRDAFDPKGRRA